MKLELINPKVKALLEKRIYRFYPIKQLSTEFRWSEKEVCKIIEDNKPYIIYLKHEKSLINKNKYYKLATLSFKAIKEILKTSNGDDINIDLMKIKRDVANSVLESIGVKKPKNIQPAIQFNTQFNNNKKNEINMIEREKKDEVKSLLENCKVSKEEVVS